MKKVIVAVFIIALSLVSVSSGAAGSFKAPDKKSHPYLFFSKDDIPAMRKSASTTHKHYYDVLKKWGDKYIGFNPLPASQLPDNIDIMQIYCENSMSYIFNMCLLYQISGDAVYLNAAKKWILEFATYPSEIKGNFCVGAYAIAIAAGYDMLYNELNPEDRIRLSQLLSAVVERGKKGTVSDWWAGISLNHDHWLPVTGLGVGAAALYYENEKAPGWLDYFLEIFKTDMRIVGEDGAWTEGTADWVYAMSLPYVLCDVYKRMFGVNMFDLPMIKNGIFYRMYSWLPNNSYVYHHDSFSNGRYNVLGSVSSHLLHKLASEHKDRHMQWLAAQDEILDLKDLNENKPVKQDWTLSKNSLVPYIHCLGWNYLWYDPKIKPLAPDNLPLHHYFPNQGLINVRSGWESKDFVFSFTCAPVGGHNAYKAVTEGNRKILSNFGHVHAQANSFDIFAYGNYLAVPPSYGSLNSNLHNTLTIEGADQERTPIHEAKLITTEFKRDYCYLVGDATKCYPLSINLERWFRHAVYLSPNILIIADELKSSKPSMKGATVWHLDFNTEITSAIIDSLQNSIRINGKSSLQTDLLYPSKFSFENKKVSWAARQINASVKNIFENGKEQQIIAVLSALENNEIKAPISYLIKGANIIGALIENEKASKAVVFFLNSNEFVAPFKTRITLNARPNTTCYFFSLFPNQTFDINVSSRPAKNGTKNYDLIVQKGKKYKSSSEGTVVFNLDK